MLYFITIDDYFGHGLKVEDSLDVSEVSKCLAEKGIDSKVKDIRDISEIKLRENDYVWLSSHQNPDVKKYINDIAIGLFIENQNKLIPSLKLFLAHDNKGLQSMLYNSGREFGLIPQRYCMDGVSQNFEGKKVFKSISGAGGQGVSLTSADGLESKVLKMKSENTSKYECKLAIREFFKKIIKGSNFNNNYNSYIKKKALFVLQDYIKGLEYDYKVLVFYDRVYVLKRFVRDNDFRASGSGNFIFEIPSNELLDFCINVREIIGSPFVSLDVAETEEGYSCIEYQCTHFGPYTQINSKYYFSRKNGIWNRIEKENKLEQDYAYALNHYLNTKLK